MNHFGSLWAKPYLNSEPNKEMITLTELLRLYKSDFILRQITLCKIPLSSITNWCSKFQVFPSTWATRENLRMGFAFASNRWIFHSTFLPGLSNGSNPINYWAQQKLFSTSISCIQMSEKFWVIIRWLILINNQLSLKFL